MLRATLFMIVKNWKNINCLQWISGCDTLIMEYYSAIRRNELLITCNNLDKPPASILSEKSQFLMVTYSTVLFI